jgi:LysR family transcriptional regulator, regulator for genes of the gallate degradation pathway
MEISDFNLRHLRALAVVTRLGSVSATAKAISLTQPAITQAIAKLESGCGQVFFERTTEGMVPTLAALLFAGRIERALGYIASTRVTMAQMKALIAVADAGSYVGASEQTGLAQPSLHRSIADLSIALKRTLVERRGKGIGLTQIGRQTARAFRLGQNELTAGLVEIAGLRGQETGKLSIGAMPLSRARLLPAAISAFHSVHPEVEISIIEGSFLELIEPLRDGMLDLIVGALRDPSPGSDVVQRAILDDKPIVLGRKNHPALQSDGDLEDLARYPWILSAPSTPLRIQWEQMFARCVTRPHVPIESGSVMLIRQILIESDFLTLLSSDQVAVELEAQWLTKIADTPPDFSRTIGMTTRANWQPTSIQSKFINILTKKPSEA